MISIISLKAVEQPGSHPWEARESGAGAGQKRGAKGVDKVGNDQNR